MDGKLDTILKYLKDNFKIIIEVIDSESNKLNCPFHFGVGIGYFKKTLYIAKDVLTDMQNDDETIGAVIHEAGHIVACNQEPENSKEELFHGWELMVAIENNLVNEWFNSNKDYVCGKDFNNKEFGRLDKLELVKYTAEIINLSINNGLIKNQKPQCIR